MSRPLVIGCGMLERELRFVAQRRGWAVDFELLSPMLHVRLPELAREFTAQLERTRDQEACVAYGACHPAMDRWLARHGRRRLAGSNCIEFLLGPEAYGEALAAGAFFLLEEGVRQWGDAIERTFGARPALVRQIFQSAHTHLLALKTPCSGDFAPEAEALARELGLPLAWRSVDLSHLEHLAEALLFPERAA